jgi:phosphoribosylamine--glycine ligase
LAAIDAPIFTPQSALTIVMAAKGYPASPQKGGAIHGVDDVDSNAVTIFHAGTKWVDGQLVASGGRVLNVTAMGGNIRAAHDAAYGAVQSIDFASGFYRSDIGWREIARLGDNQS